MSEFQVLRQEDGEWAMIVSTNDPRIAAVAFESYAFKAESVRILVDFIVEDLVQGSVFEHREWVVVGTHSPHYPTFSERETNA